MKKLTNKQRYFNLMLKLNGIVLNESVFDVNVGKNLLYTSFEQFLKNELTIMNSESTIDDVESYIELKCINDNGDNIIFNFKAISNESDLDGVFNITEAQLIKFTYNFDDSSDNIIIDDNGLQEFNQKYRNTLIEVLGDYIDVESKEPDVDKSLYDGESDDNENLNQPINERRKVWVDGSEAVKVKKECRLGGLGDGTSKACNQGDINNLEFSKLIEKKNNKKQSKGNNLRKKIKENFGVPGYSHIRLPQDNTDDDIANILLGYEMKNVDETTDTNADNTDYDTNSDEYKRYVELGNRSFNSLTKLEKFELLTLLHKIESDGSRLKEKGNKYYEFNYR